MCCTDWQITVGQAYIIMVFRPGDKLGHSVSSCMTAVKLHCHEPGQSVPLGKISRPCVSVCTPVSVCQCVCVCV